MFKWFFTFLAQRINESLNRHCPQGIAATCADVDTLALNFLITHNEREGDLFHLRFADLEPEFFVTQIKLDTNPGTRQGVLTLPGEFVMVVGDGQDTGLDRSKPRGKGPCEVLRQDADKPFHRAHDGTMHHDRAMSLTVFAHV